MSLVLNSKTQLELAKKLLNLNCAPCMYIYDFHGSEFLVCHSHVLITHTHFIETLLVLSNKEIRHQYSRQIWTAGTPPEEHI